MQPKRGLPAMKRRVAVALRDWRQTPALRVSSDPSDVESMTIRYLMLALTPAWLLPGIADHVMHRRTRISRTAWRRRLRGARPPGSYLAAVGTGITALIALPYAEELWRCARDGRR